MDLYFAIAATAAFIELVFLLHAISNLHYTSIKYNKPRLRYRPKAIVIIPCKGLDTDFENNIESFFRLDYEGYRLYFVVEDESDPAFAALNEIKERISAESNAGEVKILVAGKTSGCSQKIHNLLYGCRQITEDVEIIAFADSDICVRPNWLAGR